MTKDALSELLAQKAALEKQIADVQRGQRADAITQVKAMMAEYGLSLADIGGVARATASTRRVATKVAVKYRNPATGETWSGRGLKPKWLSAALASGRQLSDFTV
jgi:DNA-binding protein H-NS